MADAFDIFYALDDVSAASGFFEVFIGQATGLSGVEAALANPRMFLKAKYKTGGVVIARESGGERRAFALSLVDRQRPLRTLRVTEELYGEKVCTVVTAACGFVKPNLENWWKLWKNPSTMITVVARFDAISAERLLEIVMQAYEFLKPSLSTERVRIIERMRLDLDVNGLNAWHWISTTIQDGIAATPNNSPIMFWLALNWASSCARELRANRRNIKNAGYHAEGVMTSVESELGDAEAVSVALCEMIRRNVLVGEVLLAIRKWDGTL